MVENKASKIRLRLWLKILRYTRSKEMPLREKFRTEFNTTLPRFEVLAVLFQYDKGIKMSELSSFLLVSNGNATHIVDKLVNEGYIERHAVPNDRRALMVKLTKWGKSEFLKQAEVHEKWIDDIFQKISPTQAQQILDILDADLNAQ